MRYNFMLYCRPRQLLKCVESEPPDTVYSQDDNQDPTGWRIVPVQQEAALTRLENKHEKTLRSGPL